MPAMIAAALGAASFGSSMLGARRSRREARRLRGRMYWATREIEPMQRKSFAQRQALTKQATSENLAGYQAAKREAERMGRSSTQSVLDREQQLGAQASQGLASRGLGSTTIGANLQRGIASDTNRSIQGINEGLAGLRGDLALGEAGARSAGTQQLADLERQRNETMVQMAAARRLQDSYQGGIFGGAPPSQVNYGPGFGESLFSGLQTGLGAYAGMGGFGGQGMDRATLSWLFGGRPGGYNPMAGQNIQPGGSFVQGAY